MIVIDAARSRGAGCAGADAATSGRADPDDDDSKIERSCVFMKRVRLQCKGAPFPASDGAGASLKPRPPASVDPRLRRGPSTALLLWLTRHSGRSLRAGIDEARPPPRASIPACGGAPRRHCCYGSGRSLRAGIEPARSETASASVDPRLRRGPSTALLLRLTRHSGRSLRAGIEPARSETASASVDPRLRRGPSTGAAAVPRRQTSSHSFRIAGFAFRSAGVPSKTIWP